MVEQRHDSGGPSPLGADSRRQKVPQYAYEIAVTVDVALLTIRNGALRMLLIQRSAHPYKGHWALPGAFLLQDEELETAAIRALKTETDVDAAMGHLEQLATYGWPDRDPRKRVVTVAYFAIVPGLTVEPYAGGAAYSELVPVAELEERRITLAFDHERIALDAVERARSKLEYSTIATKFCDRSFTLSELRSVYETVWNARLDPANFRRKVLSAQGFVQPVGAKTAGASGRGRPADLYAAGNLSRLAHPMQRSWAMMSEEASDNASDEPPEVAHDQRSEGAEAKPPGDASDEPHDRGEASG